MMDEIADLLELVFFVMLEWVPGYTTPEKGPQKKVTLIEEGDQEVVFGVRVHEMGNQEPEKFYRVKVEVTEDEFWGGNSR